MPNVSDITDDVISASEERALDIYFNVIGAVFVIPTIVGNSLILIAIARFHALKKVNHYIMIGNLAISDLLIGMVVLPVDTTFILDDEDADIFLKCLVLNCMTYTCIAASVFNLFILSLERFHAIQYPLQHPARVTKRRIYIVIAMSWVFIILLGFSPLYGYEKRIKPLSACRAKYVYTDVYRRMLISIILGCIIASCVFYVIIFKIALRKIKAFSNITRSTDALNQSHRKLSKDMRHSRVMLLISGLFILFWAPYCVTIILPSDNERFAYIRSWLSGLGLINSCLNWIVFGARLKQFKEAFKNILNCTCMNRDFELRSSSST